MQASFALYKPLDSPLHRLSPVAKLVVALSIMAGVLIAREPVTQLAILGLELALVSIAQIRPSVVLTFAKAALYLSVLFSGTWLVFTHAGHPIFGTWGPTDVGVRQAIAAALKVFVMIMASVLFLHITSQTELVQALRRLRLPYVVCFTLMLSLRLLPSLLEDLGTIRQAQMSRGFELQKGSLIARSRRSIRGLVPLVAVAFRRVETLARALESRAFDVRGMRRTAYRDDPVGPVDLAVIAASLSAVVAIVVLGV